MSRLLLVRPAPGTHRPGDPALELAAEAGPLSPDQAVGPIVIGAERAVPGSRARRVEVVAGGWRFEFDVEDRAQAALREQARRGEDGRAGGGPIDVRAIIPGRVVAVDVAMGDRVAAGAHLLVLEAMKMQNELRAPQAGVVVRVAVTAGLTVERGDLLLVIDPSGSEAASAVDGPEPLG